jgi:hypothetical protein
LVFSMKRRFKVSKDIAKSFSSSRAFKKATSTSGGGDDSRRWMSLRIHNLPSGRLKNDIFEVDEAMFQGDGRPCENIFCILGIQKAKWRKSRKWCFKQANVPENS